MSNVGFSGGPSECPFSMYSTTNSIELKNPHGQNQPIDPLKLRMRSGFFNNQGYKLESHIADEGNEKKADFEDHPDFRSTYKGQYIKDGSIHGVLDEHDKLIEAKGRTLIKGSKTGFKSNSDGFSGKEQLTKDKGTTRDTFKGFEFDMYHPEIKKLIQPGKHKKYPNCGYLHSEKETLNTRGLKLADNTTYRDRISGISNTFFSNEVPKVPKKKLNPSFIKSEIPATEISRKQVEDLKKFEEERENKMHPTILRRMKKRDRITYDDITKKRGQYSTISNVFHDEKDTMSQKSGRKFATSFASQVHTDTNLHPVKEFDNREDRQKFNRYYDGKQPRVERRFNSSGFRKNVSEGSYLKNKEFESISDTLVYDHKKIKTFHPTIAKMVKTRHPSSYGDAVPTYQHKRRNV